jgi:hypothetical protein
MKQLTLIIIASLLLPSCQKTIEKKAEDAIIKAMTDGQWVITNFTTNGTDITSDFMGYKFQYYSDYTVSAKKNGQVDKTGTWQGDAGAMTITANFANAINPIESDDDCWN